MTASREFLAGTLVPWFLLATAVTAFSAESGGLSPDASLRALQEGNARFVSGKPTMPNQDAARRQGTAKDGQHPFATVLGCADSREPVELLFDAGIGDIFVVRVAGNVADTDEIGTVEYGAEHLKSPLLVVLGHGGCGAVTAVVRGDKVEGSIPLLVDNIVPAAAQARKDKPGALEADVISRAIELNVLRSIEDLMARSGIVRELVHEGALKVVGGVYDLATGGIRWLGEHPRQAALLSAGGGPQEPKPAAAPKAEPAPSAAVASADGSVLLPALSAAGLCALMAAAYLAFVSRAAKIRRMKARTRLIACALTGVFAVAAALLEFALLSGRPGGGGAAALAVTWVPVAAAVVFTFAYVLSISRDFHEHVMSLKERIRALQEG